MTSVVSEDPALSLGPDKVVMWSYPVVSDALVYVVDIRNGLYILRYTGPGSAQVADIDFLDADSRCTGCRAQYPPRSPRDARSARNCGAAPGGSELGAEPPR